MGQLSTLDCKVSIHLLNPSDTFYTKEMQNKGYVCLPLKASFFRWASFCTLILVHRSFLLVYMIFEIWVEIYSPHVLDLRFNSVLNKFGYSFARIICILLVGLRQRLLMLTLLFYMKEFGSVKYSRQLDIHLPDINT